ncbi:MAG: DUF3189 family protein [Firmicutes bacterium]|nr:DUF3189 family protein [Bacillota bacterium]
MIYLYIGVRDLYLPAAAAYMHLQGRNELTAKELLAFPYFRPAQKADEGRLYYLGTDADNHPVYIACVADHPDVFHNAVQSLLTVYGLPPTTIQVVPCLLENLQLAAYFRLLTRIGLDTLADRLGLKIVLNRLPDLVREGVAF